jgi:RNA polymerase sporulation-specific sigma factor
MHVDGGLYGMQKYRRINMLIKLSIQNKFQFRMIPDIRTIILGQRGEIHYIGGAEVLPAPLDSIREAEVIRGLGTERDSEMKAILVEHNLRLVVYIAKKFDNTGVGVEDLISIGTIGLIKAINTFNPDKNIKLATYASRCIENEILMYLRRNNKTKLEVSIDEPLNVDWDGNELLLSDILGTEEDVIYRNIEEEVDRKLLRKALSKLSDRERIIVDLRFGLNTDDGNERTQKEVADLLGISQSYISRLEKKIIKRLKKEMVRFE